MLRLAALAAVAGLTFASCSGGHGASSLLPHGAAAPQSGARAARDTAIVAPPGWAATATRGATIANATDKGPLAATTPITVRLGLHLRNTDQLAAGIAAGQVLSPQQFQAQYGPTAAEVQSVVSYLQSQGFHNVKAGAQLVSADGTAAQAAKAFNTTLESFSLGGGNVYVNTAPALVPSSLDGVVTAVLGLTNAGKMAIRPDLSKVHSVACLVTATPTGQCLPAFNAADVQKFYDVGTVTDGSMTTVAVIAEGNVSQVLTDLQYAENKQGLPQVPVTVVQVGLPSPDTSGVVEWDLDTQSSTGMAQNVQSLMLYATTSLSDSDIASAYDKWVSDDAAKLGNSSFGECEYSAWLDGAMKVDDALFMRAAGQGQTMFASSGDTGSACALAPTNGVPASGAPFVSYPASSPYVVAVGGTTVVANADGTYSGEAAWNAGGGGLSQFENASSLQQGVAPNTGAVAAANLRAVPDIAMAADAVSGAYNVYAPNIPGVGDCSSGCAIGGTSEASPLAMGASARFATNSAIHQTRRGYMGTYFYRDYNSHQSNATTVNGPPPTQALGGFHDVITGANGAYAALPGYDYTTGLGTLDVGVMNPQIAL
ncbi:MAG TPA: protease pro-enzyme activation domain-containing protein [Candidatus Elarobacter sp.]|jgi:subtilase family serine protease|nr:protease pro-enzyme activation domain-containing protein [Candidatus Elarobacter sp.]